jgi:hypothetical protein
MDISRRGGRARSMSSTVRGRCSSPGCVITILNPPTSDSRAILVSGTVESDIARLCLILGKASLSDMYVVVGVEGKRDGVKRVCVNPDEVFSAVSVKDSKPAVPGGVIGNTKLGWGYR